MSIINSQPLIGASGSTGYKLQRSVRLRSSASAYFNRTPASAGNRKTWTWSAWVKRGSLGTTSVALFALPTIGGVLYDAIGFYSDALRYVATDNGSTFATELNTTAVFRDPSAWYHIVYAVDTTQAINTNRIKLYVNGIQITAFSTATYPSQNRDTAFNSANEHRLGRWIASYEDCYLTEVNFIDGQALTPSAFGEIDSTTGVWKPKAYNGTYGTNGFFLKFADNSGSTATTIGKDSSGNGNNWTPNNISVTAGATYDSMLDVPTLTSNTNANFCTLNPLQRFDTSSFAGVYSSGNLIVASGGNPTHAFGTISIAAGDTTGWYWEGVCTSMDTARTYIGICCPTDGPTSVGASYAFTTKFVLANTGQYWQASTSSGSPNGTYTSYAANDVMMVAYKNGSLWIGKNGVWMNSGDPVAGTGAVSTTLSTSKEWSVYFGYNSTWSTNFGQRPFTYTPPSGFKSLNTYNLPAPTIPKGNKHFNALVSTGDGNLTRTFTGVGFQPDLVWQKDRTSAVDHWLIDSVRGAAKNLQSNTTLAEVTSGGTNGALNQVESDGYSILQGSSTSNNVNKLNDSYVAWCWKASNAAPVTNTSGSISSQVSANPGAGFSIVTYTGTGSAGATVGHGLNIKPSLIIVKQRTTASTTAWAVYHSALDSGDSTNSSYLVLNTTAAKSDVTTGDAETVFGNGTVWKSPTSSVFTIGANSQVNASSGTYVAYCFSEIAGFSKFGSYTGNGSTDGTFVFTNFKPRWVMIKNTTTGATSWCNFDSSRDTSNVVDLVLYPNTSDAEQSFTAALDFLSNGFKLRATDNRLNASSNTYIYAVFAENPFKNALAY